MKQEIDIKINCIFLNKQIRKGSEELEKELINCIENNNVDEPIKVTEIETSMKNFHVRLTTSVNADKTKEQIGQYIIEKIKLKLPMWIVKGDVISLREEAEIYENN